MATAITPTKSTRVNQNPAAAGVAGALAALDAAGNTFANTGREILIVTTDATPRTIQFTDKAGANVGAAVTLAASKTFVFGPFDAYNYGSTVAFTVSNAAVTGAVITLADPGKSVQVGTGG